MAVRESISYALVSKMQFGNFVSVREMSNSRARQNKLLIYWTKSNFFYTIINNRSKTTFVLKIIFL